MLSNPQAERRKLLNLFYKKNFEKALELYTSILSYFIDDPDFRKLGGDIYFNLGMTQAAVGEYRQALNLYRKENKLNQALAVAEKKEYGFKELFISEDRTDLFEGITSGTQVWMSHGDRIEKLPPGFKIIAYTDNSPYAAIYHPSKNIFGVQFHPEVVHTKDGRKILENFIFRICKAPKNWEIKDFTELKIREIQERVGKDKVLLALSGGVDSSVVAKLLEKAIGFNYYPVFIDTGLLKLGEKARVKKYFGNNPNLIL